MSALSLLCWMGVSIAGAQAIPGASVACNNGLKGLDSILADAISDYNRANEACFKFCEPLTGLQCSADCSSDLGALETACHNEAAHIYSVQSLVSLPGGMLQQTLAYKCFPGTCRDSDIALYANDLRSRYCNLSLPFILGCSVTARLDDEETESEDVVEAVGIALGVLAVLAIAVVGVLAWRWRARMSETTTAGTEMFASDEQNNESVPILSRAQTRTAPRREKSEVSTRALYRARYGSSSSQITASAHISSARRSSGLPASLELPLTCDESGRGGPDTTTTADTGSYSSPAAAVRHPELSASADLSAVRAASAAGTRRAVSHS
jgi:hypothetical protein